jgi:hypothetical protein
MESDKIDQTTENSFEKLHSKFYGTGINYYKELFNEEAKRFNKSGEIEIVNADGTSYSKAGNKFIQDLIKYFESKDSGPYYRMCADLKKLLKEYYLKFPDRRCKSEGLTELEKAKLDLHYAHVHAYHQLRRYGPNLGSSSFLTRQLPEKNFWEDVCAEQL